MTGPANLKDRGPEAAPTTASISGAESARRKAAKAVLDACTPFEAAMRRLPQAAFQGPITEADWADCRAAADRLMAAARAYARSFSDTPEEST